MADNKLKTTTPVGKLMWVVVAGVGKVNYNEDGHEYCASVVLTKKAALPLIKAIEELYKSCTKKGNKVRSMGYRTCTAEGLQGKGYEEESDFYSFNFKTKTTFQDGKQKIIGVYNASAGKVDLDDARIGNGTTGAISGIMAYNTIGKDDWINLWLNAVQIIDFIEYDEDTGFEEQEGTYKGEETGFVSNPEKPLSEDSQPDATGKLKL